MSTSAVRADYPLGGRHELYERHYAGNHENIRVEAFLAGDAGGLAESLKNLVRGCMKDYDLDGWPADDLINASDLGKSWGSR